MKLPLTFIVICLVLTPVLCGWFRSEPERSWFEKLTSSWTKEEPKSYWSNINPFSWYKGKESEPKSSWSASWYGTLQLLDHNLVTRSKQEPEQQSSWNPLAWIAFAATPVVLVKSIISALGFGASGIAPGSVGATMMSGAAIAAGGGVAKGGLVAYLQSAGVVGLGYAAWPLTIVGLGVGYLWLQS